MPTLEQLKEKYGNARHTPDLDCPKCNGAGEFYYEGECLTGWKPCYCIFIEHDFLPIYREIMTETIRKIRDELR